MKHELKPELRLILTPKLLHYLTVLQLPLLDLVQTLRHELETNPVLEEVESESEDESEPELENFYDEIALYLPEARDDDYNPLENIPAPPENIFSHLEKEIRKRFRGEELKIAMAFLYDLDHEGLIHTGEEELSKKLGVDLKKVHEIREVLKRIDPVGCFSYNSIEALRTQLICDGFHPDSEIYQTFEDLIRGDNEKLKPELLRKLAKYHPKPGLKYSEDRPQYVVPDIIVVWQENNFVGFLNEDPIPKVRIRREIIDILRAPKAFSKEEVRFARDKVRSARNLLNSIAERNQTLRKLTEIIIEAQEEYFRKGEEYIKPLTMKSVAEKLNINISTVSRAVAGKYLESPRGIMALKKFFLSGRSPQKKFQITRRIAEILTSESESKPLSDSEIARKLAEEGIIVARRTVAKYRKELGFKSKKERKPNES